MIGWFWDSCLDGIALHAQSLYPDFSKLNFGCDGNSITAGEQWSKTVVDKLGFATHHNVAVGSATWACHPDTQDYGSEAFAGISGGWQVTEDRHELQMRHNNVSKVHIQKFIAEVESGAYPAPDVLCSLWERMTVTWVVPKRPLKGRRSMK